MVLGTFVKEKFSLCIMVLWEPTHKKVVSSPLPQLFVTSLFLDVWVENLKQVSVFLLLRSLFGQFGSTLVGSLPDIPWSTLTFRSLVV